MNIVYLQYILLLKTTKYDKIFFEFYHNYDSFTAVLLFLWFLPFLYLLVLKNILPLFLTRRILCIAINLIYYNKI